MENQLELTIARLRCEDSEGCLFLSISYHYLVQPLREEPFLAQEEALSSSVTLPQSGGRFLLHGVYTALSIAASLTPNVDTCASQVAKRNHGLQRPLRLEFPCDSRQVAQFKQQSLDNPPRSASIHNFWELAGWTPIKSQLLRISVQPVWEFQRQRPVVQVWRLQLRVATNKERAFWQAVWCVAVPVQHDKRKSVRSAYQVRKEEEWLLLRRGGGRGRGRGC